MRLLFVVTGFGYGDSIRAEAIINEFLNFAKGTKGWRIAMEKTDGEYESLFKSSLDEQVLKIINSYIIDLDLPRIL